MSRYSAEELLRALQGEIAAVLSFTAAVARRRGLEVSEIAALEHLQGAGELTPGQLAARLSMTSGAVTALVDRLERIGHVQRSPNPRDRRSSILRVTPAGAEDAVRYLAPLAEEITQIATGLSDEERDTAGKFLEQLTAAISRQT